MQQAPLGSFASKVRYITHYIEMFVHVDVSNMGDASSHDTKFRASGDAMHMASGYVWY